MSEVLQLFATVMMCTAMDQVNAGFPMEKLLRPRVPDLFNKKPPLQFCSEKQQYIIYR